MGMLASVVYNITTWNTNADVDIIHAVISVTVAAQCTIKNDGAQESLLPQMNVNVVSVLDMLQNVILIHR
jgi:hypothetical protein